MEQNMQMIWRATQDRYADGIAAIHAELESALADFDQRIDAHDARLQERLRGISSDVQANPLAREHPETTAADVTPQHSTLREGYTPPDLHSLR